MHEVEVRESPIQGRGVFAVSEIPAGELIREYNLVREITASRPVDPEQGESVEHCTYPGDRVFLVGPPDRYFNHSCDPNAFKRFRGDGIELVARRDISAGSEITHDYLINTHGGSTWTCRCGSPRCRGTMPASFFCLPEPIQIEYAPLLADWFVARHASRVDALRRRTGVGGYYGLVERFKIPGERHRAMARFSEGVGARQVRGRKLSSEKVDALIWGLSHANAAVRRCCLELLDTHPSERAIPHIVARLDDPVPRVRWHAVHAVRCDVCKAGSSFLTPALIERLRQIAASDPSPRVRREASLGLAEGRAG